MSAETDVALMVELEEKIDQRVRDGVYKAIYGFTSSSPVSASMVQSAVANAAKTQILNDTAFLTELTKRIGQRMQNAY
jgi:hypothetical protein